MIQCVYAAVAAAVAWWIGLAFLRVHGIGAVLHAAVTGILCGGLCRWMQSVELMEMFLAAEALLFVLSALTGRLWHRLGWDNLLHILLVAQGAFVALWLPGRGWEELGLTAIWLGIPTVAVFAIMAICLRDRFPRQDWRDAFSDEPDESGHNGPHWQQMYLIPACVWLLLTAVSRLLPIQSIPGGVGACLLTTAVFWMGIWQMIAMTKYQSQRTVVRTEQMYRDEMQSFLNVIRSQRHDYNFHVQTIAGLIRQGKVEECLRYVNALEEDTAIMNAVLPVRDPAISAMIHSFRLQAVRQGIEIHVDIHYDMAQIATNVYETNKIISNLLQNAIDEVSAHEDKSYGIHLTILKRGEFCVIRVSNKIRRAPTQEDLGNIYQQGYTTKTGHDGVGLSSLRTLVGRYHGAIYTQVEGDVIEFVARVPINYAKQPAEE